MKKLSYVLMALATIAFAAPAIARDRHEGMHMDHHHHHHHTIGHIVRHM